MLTQEQRELLENSLWVVNSVLKAQGLQRDDDMRSRANLYLCKCVQRYKPERNAKWTTYAYKSVFLFVKTSHAQEMVEKSHLASGNGLFLAKDETDYEEIVLNNILLEQIRESLGDIDKIIFDLKRQDYTIREICERLQLSDTAIDNHWNYIKNVAKKVFTNV